MRTPRALLHAMRNRRTHRIGHAEADELVTGDHNGPTHAALKELLDAARAPATARELAGEKAAVAAFTAHRRRAARARERHPARTRTAVVSTLTALALLTLGGTALAARTGNLPQEAQQHAHRLFSALGVPAPRTGTPSPTPSPAPTPAVIQLGWCDAWPSTKPLTSSERRQLITAAGGEDGVDRYCAALRTSASATPRPGATAPTTSPGATPGPPGSTPGQVAPPGGSKPTPSDGPSPTPTPPATGSAGASDAPGPTGAAGAPGSPGAPGALGSPSPAGDEQAGGDTADGDSAGGDFGGGDFAGGNPAGAAGR